MSHPKTINIDQVLESKMGKNSRFVPRFLVNYLKRIIHQDWINDFILKEGETVGVTWMEDCLKYLGLHLNIEGLEHLPDDTDGRRFTFVSNHPLGGADGIMLGSFLGRRYNERICFLANDLLMNLTGIAPFFVPINKTGKQSREFPKMVETAFHSNNHLIMFPAGLCSRKIDGIIQDVEWKKTFVTKSIESHRDVVPIYLEGRNSDFFYRLANVSKRLGIKFNIAMLYLVDELYKSQNKTFTLKIGKPIPWQSFTKDKTPTEWAAVVRDTVYQLNARTS
ncbi:glycerol acyltransferase [Alloprevotella sp. OH1205_COT-284]|uniref:1-acyl-sn-glycerol-3-phosphate acyltransferase n=1 Tax=Alloprevotella sp. OH1205_COT-284 TaxID=2491043 RepID=UPI000F5D98CD|nr:1-acyl-sn-glycerol-3-phosphate acyltransferase [Alloprevotella sp. OH1205_COT-284]RRD80544.1 glycerol acyltransferase [Alloprevotella sp. OH1205_COT-284]